MQAVENNLLQVLSIYKSNQVNSLGYYFTAMFKVTWSIYLLYRDGVSDGQFYQVLLYELDAIRKVSLYISQLLLASSDCFAHAPVPVPAFTS